MLFSVIAFIVICVIVVLYQESKSKAVSQEIIQIKNSFSYDRNSHLLILKSRSPNVQNVIKAEASHDINFTSIPDKLVYTGATVGGVSTGGFHVQKGGNYVSLGAKTGRYYLSYKYAEAFNGKHLSDIVSCVELTDSDFTLAKNNNVLKQYIASPETKKRLSDFHSSSLLANCKHLLFLNNLSKSDAEYIVKWMSGKN